MVISMVYILQKNIKEFQPKQEIRLQLKSTIIVQCDKRFSYVESRSLLGMATVWTHDLKNFILKTPLHYPRC